MSMRILITGAAGTLGAPLTTELRARGHQVFGLNAFHTADAADLRADVANYRELERVIIQTGPDVVYHLAAEFGRLNGDQYYEQTWQTNVIGTRHLLELAAEHGFRIVHASSSEVYGESDEANREDWPARLGDLKNDYALSKWVNEQQILNAAERHGVEAVRCRFFNAYGPGEHYHPYRSVVCLFCHAALNDLPYTVFHGYHRVFMFIADFIPTLANVCERFKPGAVYNIGGSDYRSVRDLSDLILDHLGKNDGNVTYLSSDKHNVRNKRPDISRAAADLGHDPRVTLEEGVPATIEWMREQAAAELEAA